MRMSVSTKLFKRLLDLELLYMFVLRLRFLGTMLRKVWRSMENPPKVLLRREISETISRYCPVHCGLIIGFSCLLLQLYAIYRQRSRPNGSIFPRNVSIGSTGNRCCRYIRGTLSSSFPTYAIRELDRKS